MTSILEKIVRHKKGEIATAKRRIPIQDLKSQCSESPTPRNFHSALTSGQQKDRISLIAEVKKGSPSQGLIRKDFHPVEIAGCYANNGAACISVLTDENFFQGHLSFLKEIRHTISIPLLRKDFILDEYQVWEARAAGADAVLLIAECLDPNQMIELNSVITGLGMTALIELYESDNIPAVLACNPNLVGVNNRDLNTFEIDLEHSIRVKKSIPSSVAMVSESGIFTHDDVLQMHENGVDAILVGESLMRSDDIGAATRSLMGF